MGWLDKLLGRDKQEAGEPAAGASTSMERGEEAAAAAEDADPHAGHDHPPGEHPHEEHP